MRPREEGSWLIDVHVYGGLALIATGAGLLSGAAALIVLGVGLVAIGRWG